ncbi:hypothetical protein GCM10010341_50100 [Streptomyces noursei]|nr:hypothetical protein GCM10010341_50100 [Streptomyces noursei]
MQGSALSEGLLRPRGIGTAALRLAADLRAGTGHAEPSPPVATAGQSRGIPPLFCPIPSSIHPHAADIERRALAWAEEFGLGTSEVGRRRLIGSKSAQWCCRLAPDGDPELLELAAEWTYASFLFDDDHLDESGSQPDASVSMIGEVLRALDSPESTDASNSPYPAAYRDLSRRLRKAAGAVAVRRWIDGHTEWFLGALSGLTYRAASRHFSLGDCLNMGHRDAGIKICYSLVEIANGAALPDDVLLASRPLQVATQAAHFLVSADAAIFSFDREVDQGSEQINLVNALMRHLDCDRGRALVEAVALRDAVMVLLMQLRRQTPGVVEQLYLRQLGTFVSGNLHWCLTNERYNTEVGRSPGSTGLSSMPTEGTIDPRTLPQIGWWWRGTPTRG